MTDLTTFARRLMRIREKAVQSNTARAIFGSVGELPQSIATRAPYRIGLWPCISDENPVFAMGLWVVLAHLLERWQDIQVYRLFVKLDGEPDTFEWTIDQSQFEVDEWPVEPLDENIAIWGKLTQVDDKWQLKISIENDLLTGEDNDTIELTFTGDSLVSLLAQTPAIAAKLATTIEAERLDETEPIFSLENLPDETVLKPFFSHLIHWDVMLIASLWGVDIEDEDAEDDFEALIELSKAVPHDIAAWLTSKAVAHTMLPGYSVIGDLFADRVDEITEAFPKSDLPAPLLAWSIYQMGDAESAYDLLEEDTKSHPESVAGWLRLAELYAVGGRIEDSIARFQSAIEKKAISSQLYRAYGNILVVADQRGTLVEDFVLINEEDADEEDSILYEAIAAYKETLKIDPKNTRALYSQLLQMLYVDDEDSDIWSAFKELLALDETGEYVRDIIEGMYEIDDIRPGLSAITAAIKEHGERLDLLINLASLHLSQENGDEAKPYLEKAKSLADTVDKLADVERLLLVADDAEFEQRFGELEAIVDAGNSLSAEDTEYLEDTAEKAPHLIAAHLALARAYHIWGDKDAALEVLLDTQEKTPNNPAVLEILAKILRESDEKELAFEYLNKGLLAYPFHVPLLVQTGRYLFDNGQIKEARSYIGRAEEISPRDPSLQGIRTYIAQKMAENPSLYTEDDD